MTAFMEARDVRKAYRKRLVLDGVALALSEGEAVALIGPNGAGKTTLLRILMGLVQPDDGVVVWHGRDVGRASKRFRIGYFGGGHTIPPNVSSRAWSRSAYGVEETGMEPRPVRTLSRGNRQMLGLRTVLSRQDWAVVLLDEPWEGLDPDGARWLSATVREGVAQGRCFLLSSHRLHDLAGLCHRYAFLVKGNLLVRSASDIAERADVRGDDLLATFDELRAAE